MREKIERCKICNQKMRKAGKVLKVGKKAQRYQCTNESCPNYGKYIIVDIKEEKIRPMSPEELKASVEGNYGRKKA